jgi:hypothetical protein
MRGGGVGGRALIAYRQHDGQSPGQQGLGGGFGSRTGECGAPSLPGTDGQVAGVPASENGALAIPAVEPEVSAEATEAPVADRVLLRAEPSPVPVAAPALLTAASVTAAPPALRVLAAAPPLAPEVSPADPKPAAPKRLVNDTHLSLTDPEAELARSKNGLTELNYKDHRLVDDAHGVITAVATTRAQVADGTQLPALIEQHQANTGLKLSQVTVAGDHHYGTVANYLYCTQEGMRPHLGELSANVAGRGLFALDRFVYEPEHDRLRCPQGHYLVLHQHRPEEHAQVYLIEDPQHCAQCPLRAQCTKAKEGRSIQRQVQAEVIAAAVAEANSPAGRFSRQRRQHVMEGSFADAANNHGAKRARWRGLGRQQIQSWLIAAVQNLRILLRHAVRGPEKGGVALERQAVPTFGIRIPRLRRPGRGLRAWVESQWTPWRNLEERSCL